MSTPADTCDARAGCAAVGHYRRAARVVLTAVVLSGACIGDDPQEWACGQVAAPGRIRPVQYRGGPPFDLRSAIIPLNEIRRGGPPKDGIPALSNPLMIRPGEARYLGPADRVIGISLGGESRAYPLKILGQHEVVNDLCGKVPVAVTYCPLCDSVAVFDRRTELGVREFGVSGLLYNSNVLMYDRGGAAESLWSQMAAQGVSGPGVRRRLKVLPVELTAWQDWVARHPETKVLSARTGYARNYLATSYGRYFSSPNLMFPVRPTSRVLPLKTPVLGIWSADRARAYPLPMFGKTGETLEGELGGRKFTLQYDPRARSLRVAKADDGLQWMYSFWFAWYAFHPRTEVFRQGR